MSTFLKFFTSFWDSDAAIALAETNPDAHHLALYFLTTKHNNMLGIFQVRPAYIVAETGRSLDVVKACLPVLEAHGILRYDYATNTAWVMGQADAMGDLKASSPGVKGDNNIVKAQHTFNAVHPRCAFIADFFAAHGKALKLREHATAGAAGAPVFIATAPKAAPAAPVQAVLPINFEAPAEVAPVAAEVPAAKVEAAPAEVVPVAEIQDYPECGDYVEADELTLEVIADRFITARIEAGKTGETGNRNLRNFIIAQKNEDVAQVSAAVSYSAKFEDWTLEKYEAVLKVVKASYADI